jgi:uncharacterized protein (TIGR02147 family)
MESIYTYTDYRKFLSDFYNERKAAKRHFSHRYIAEKVGLKSTGHFSLILKGRANISPELTVRFCEFLNLRKKETEYFESLVNFNQAKTETLKRKAFERLLSHKECRVKIVGADQFEYYDKWYYSAIHRVLDFYPFAGDYTELARMVEPTISSKDARKAVALLLKLGFIQKRPDGIYETTEKTISTGYAAQSVYISSFLFNSIDLAKRAIDKFPRDERNISSVSFSVSEHTYRIIEQKTRDFRRKIMSIVEAEPRPTRAYQFNIQVFPLSRDYNTEKTS